jgi:hypothetical protein
MSVVAGGYSFSEVDHQKIPHPVISVNDALLYLECGVELIVSMDRLWTEGRWDILCDRKIKSYIRTAALKRVKFQDKDWCRPFVCNHTSAQFGDQLSEMNGANSGYCALNLAYIFRPTELYLFGFDMQPGPKGQRRWYPLTPWEVERNYGPTTGYKFGSWANDMVVAAKMFDDIGTRVFNVSTRSLITSFDHVTPEQLGVAK